MRVVRLADVDQGQHHEDESLERDDQDVEHRPGPAGADVQQRQRHAADRQREGAAEQGNQEEDQLAGVHVAEQSHAVRHGLRHELDQLHRHVGDRQQDEADPAERIGAQLDGAERSDVELVQEAAESLDLDAVEQAQDQDADGERRR